jgi:hypothetical protein
MVVAAAQAVATVLPLLLQCDFCRGHGGSDGADTTAAVRGVDAMQATAAVVLARH